MTDSCGNSRRELSEEERARIAALSCDIPALWERPGDDVRRPEGDHPAAGGARRRAGPQETANMWTATIHWRGGFTSHHTVVRPVRRYEHLHDFDRLVDHLTRWRREGYSAGQIVEELRAAGFRPPRNPEGYTKGQVQQLLRRCGLTDDRGRWAISARTSGGSLIWPGHWTSRRSSYVTGRCGVGCTARKTPAQAVLDHLG